MEKQPPPPREGVRVAILVTASSDSAVIRLTRLVGCRPLRVRARPANRRATLAHRRDRERRKFGLGRIPLVRADISIGREARRASAPVDGCTPRDLPGAWPP